MARAERSGEERSGADWVAAGTGLPPRYLGPEPSAMSVEQCAVYDEIAGSRTTGVRGPFGPWLAAPAIAQPAQTLGRVCRYETSLSLLESELAILLTAAHHESATEWTIHEAEALRAGMSEPTIAAVRVGARPDGLDPRSAAIHDFASELLCTSGRVADGIYEAARRALGEPGVVELTAIVGYYTLVAYTLNVFRIPAS